MSEQEEFWAGNFGEEYISRNKSSNYLASNTHFFSNILDKIGDKPESVLEIGANIGMNIDALRNLIPDCRYSAVEINTKAAGQLRDKGVEVYLGSVTDLEIGEKFDLVLSKGVLIHIAPELLEKTYSTVYSLAKEWVIIAEYYNPVPVSLTYRGHQNKLFKRDFAGEFLDKYPDFSLWSSGFTYHRDKFPQDDITWFLLRKKQDEIH
jgi:pseudaminic acid biosynthesis-associated methylase